MSTTVSCVLCDHEIPLATYKRAVIALQLPPKCPKCGARRWASQAIPTVAAPEKPDPDVRQIPWAQAYFAHRDGTITRGRNGKPLKAYFHSTLRRLSVWIRDNKRSGMPCTVGRVIGEMFCDDFRRDRVLVFKDGNRLNVAASNLMFLPKSKTTEAVKGSAHYASKLTEDAVREIRFGGLSKDDAMKKFGISKTYYYHIRNGLRWKHVTE